MKEKWTCIQGRCVETIATPEVALQLVAIPQEQRQIPVAQKEVTAKSNS